MPPNTTRTADAPAGRIGTEQPPRSDDRFPVPPVAFRDDEGRRISIRTADADDFDALAAMYDDFHAESRAQQIPPVDERRRRDWLETLLADGWDVAAYHEDAPVGHASLVPIDESTAELAIFVAPGYQLAGIGSRLLRTLLGYGSAHGVEGVWLTVDRTNRVALNLYRSIGFTAVGGGAEHEMELDL
ncbi:GNAT family N-acetyltransferase [Halobacterium noricense]|uniref:GNAT family N-acetyltransferase n=1 Tax=Halobacterium noricense TaxID=223182 RepID=UPI001E4B7983|nr:GNAT family N-acetyltransferase [Halobacterium noricense]UHH24131.1 GNAT family N-acetyltransferase [Halobacterium noricense]